MDTDSPRTMPGIFVAGITAVVSGVSIFVNSYGVKSLTSPTLYTTAKNLVATVVLALVWSVGAALRRHRIPSPMANFLEHGGPPRRRARGWGGLARIAGLAYVGVVGGGLAFVLFFAGLARTQPAAAAFWRDTLVVWVALLAAVGLRERIRWWNVVAIVLLIAGEVAVTGGIGAIGAHPGEAQVLASSVLWAIEVVIAKRLLADLAPSTLSLVRMGVGAVVLVAYVGLSGDAPALLRLDARQLMWAGATGALLAVYVATWMGALARARRSTSPPCSSRARS